MELREIEVLQCVKWQCEGIKLDLCALDPGVGSISIGNKERILLHWLPDSRWSNVN
jgi:hypothetical protein